MTIFKDTIMIRTGAVDCAVGQTLPKLRHAIALILQELKRYDSPSSDS